VYEALRLAALIVMYPSSFFDHYLRHIILSSKNTYKRNREIT
jgi:hypothetical protein